MTCPKCGASMIRTILGWKCNREECGHSFIDPKI
jgi:hypothetical protein